MRRAAGRMELTRSHLRVLRAQREPLAPRGRLGPGLLGAGVGLTGVVCVALAR